jgi:hypothetical protein
MEGSASPFPDQRGPVLALRRHASMTVLVRTYASGQEPNQIGNRCAATGRVGLPVSPWRDSRRR